MLKLQEPIEINNMPFEILSKLPKSVQRIFNILQKEGPLTSAEIEIRSNYSDRTVRNALRRLIHLGFVKKTINWEDMRTSLFRLSLQSNS